MRRHVKSDNERTLTRTELRQVLFACCPSLSRQDVSKVLDGFFEEISEALAGGEPVKLRSFGTFNVRSKRERPGRNPKTGEEAPISARKVLTFKASRVLAARVNGEPINDEEE
jgi:integration host factor subunit alpha